MASCLVLPAPTVLLLWEVDLINNVKIKDIPGFPYTIDEKGIVTNKKGQQISPELTRNGYLRVSLSNGVEQHKRFLVHRLVAEAFIANPDNLPQVDHRNENKQDNSVKNLRWSTALDNLNHSRVIEKASEAKYTRVRCITTGDTFESIKDAVEHYGLHHSNIVACCNGRRKFCGGMEWEYIV